MQSDIKKIANIEVNNEPKLKPISDLGIGFYDLDDNTAVLTFQITKAGHPLLISKYNTNCYVYLESDNGSNQIVEDIKFLKPMEGLLGFIVPLEFLQASSETEVKGQIYISVNKKNKVDDTFSNTAVTTEFKFDVANSLINNISGGRKIGYIKMFDQLKSKINKTAKEINDELKNGEDYVNVMKNIYQAGVAKINQTVDEAKEAIASSIQNSQAYIENEKDKTIEQINQSVNTMTNTKNEVLETVNSRHAITQHDLNELTWQKQALTDDNGYLKTIHPQSVNQMEDESLNQTGFYYIQESNETPGNAQSGYINVYMQGTSTGYAIYRDIDDTTLYLNQKINSEWRGWSSLSFEELTSNWQKAKLTEDDGTLSTLQQIDLNEPLEMLAHTSFVYVKDAINGPHGETEGYLIFYQLSSSDMKMEFRPINSNTIYYKTMNNGVWDQWQSLAQLSSDEVVSNWITYDVTGDVVKNKHYKAKGQNGFNCAYKVIADSKYKQVIIRINMANFKNGQVIAQLPEDLINHTHTQIIRSVPTKSGGAQIVIEPSGEMKAWLVNAKEWEVSDDNYIYGEIYLIE